MRDFRSNRFVNNSRCLSKLCRLLKPQANGVTGPPGVNYNGLEFPGKSVALQTRFQSFERQDERKAILAMGKVAKGKGKSHIKKRNVSTEGESIKLSENIRASLISEMRSFDWARPDWQYSGILCHLFRILHHQFFLILMMSLRGKLHYRKLWFLSNLLQRKNQVNQLNSTARVYRPMLTKVLGRTKSHSLSARLFFLFFRKAFNLSLLWPWFFSLILPKDFFLF